MEGYIKLHRKLLESDTFMSEKVLKVFVWCLMKATHTERKILLCRQTVHLNPGQFVTGRKTAAAELGMPESTCRDIMTTLKVRQQISMESNSKYTLVTVLNWALYQVENENSDSKKSISPTANGQQMDTNKNDKNIDHYNPTGVTPKTELEREWELYYIKLNAYLEAKKSGTVMAYPEPPERPSQIVDS